MTPRITIIAAVARNRAIGRGNELPWRLPEDLKRFKALTLGHPIVMGRKTFASVGRPLPGRENIVVTRSRDFAPAGCSVVHSLEEAFSAAAGAAEVFVIGGGEIYALAMPLAHRLQLTEVDVEIEGDAYFPEFDRGAWREISREPHAAPGPHELRFEFVTYDRRKD